MQLGRVELIIEYISLMKLAFCPYIPSDLGTKLLYVTYAIAIRPRFNYVPSPAL